MSSKLGGTQILGDCGLYREGASRDPEHWHAAKEVERLVCVRVAEVTISLKSLCLATTFARAQVISNNACLH